MDCVVAALAERGVVGEARVIKLIYLVLTSRMQDRPVSAVVKGPSSAGKSFLVENVLRLFPEQTAHALSAMSEHALIYSEEPLAHRVLILYEDAGVQSDFAAYIVRSLLSEGKVRYETVEATKDGIRPKLIEREGPTGLIVTTTEIFVEPQLETRMLSIPVTDTPEQTRNVLRAAVSEEIGWSPETA